MKAKNNFILLDNTTLRDAAKFMTYSREWDEKLRTHCFSNWIKFMESLILHDKVFVGNDALTHKSNIGHLCSSFSDLVEGIDLKHQQDEIKKSIRRTLNKQKDSDHSDDWSHLHRGMFYMEVAERNGLIYQPAYAREIAFEKFLISEWILAEKKSNNRYLQNLSNRISDKILNASNAYKQELESLGAPKVIGTKIPPLSSLIFNEAKRTGSWSEAIDIVRNSKGALAFRTWIKDVSESLENGNIEARHELEEVDNFMTLWSKDPNEGVKYISRTIKIAQVLPYIKLEPAISINLKDPVIHQKEYLVFMSGMVKSNLMPIKIEQLFKIKM